MRISIPIFLFITLFLNLLITAPLTALLKRNIQSVTIAAVLGAFIGILVATALAFLVIYFEFIHAHPAAYVVLIGPFVVGAVLVSTVVARFVPTKSAK